jgi:hypothetical protein
MTPFISSQIQDEQSSLRILAAEEQALSARLNFFSMSVSSASSDQILGYVNELHEFIGRFEAYRLAANSLRQQGHPAVSDGIEALIQRAQYNLDTYEFARRSRKAFEDFQRSQGQQPTSSAPRTSGRPGPGSPEWFNAVMGNQCYWCGFDLYSFPKPVAICPRCGRIPSPS